MIKCYRTQCENNDEARTVSDVHQKLAKEEKTKAMKMYSVYQKHHLKLAVSHLEYYIIIDRVGRRK